MSAHDEQQAKILEDIAAADVALCVIQPHNAPTFKPRIEALQAGEPT